MLKLTVLFHSYYIDHAKADTSHSWAMCIDTRNVPHHLPPRGDATQYKLPVRSGDVRSEPIKRRGLQRLWTVPKGRQRQIVSEEENSNSALLILALCYHCKVHLFCVRNKSM